MMLSCRKMVFAGCLAALAACEGEPTAIVAEHMGQVAARQLWDAQGVRDYRMRVHITSAWIGGAAVVTVRDGVPVSVEPIHPAGKQNALLFADHDTVEELFAVVDRAQDDAAEHIDASYDSRYGVPVEVSIDPSKSYVDDEFGFFVETFERL